MGVLTSGSVVQIPFGEPNLCHDFVGGSVEDVLRAYANQRKLHDKLAAELVAFASDNLKGADLLKSLTPKNGATIKLGVDLNGKLGQTQSKSSIAMSITPGSDDDRLFQATLIHETGHWMSLMTFGVLNKNSIIPQYLQDAIYNQAVTGAEEVQITRDGYIGLVFEQLQFGEVVTWDY